MNLKNKQVAVVGLGKSGLAALEFLKQQGAKARATEASAKDSVACLAVRLKKQGVPVETGVHTEGFLKGVDLVVTSPGVPDTALPLRWAKRNKVKAIDEIELAFWFSPAPIIAITGTNGKSTTTELIGHILSTSGRKAVVCGNIGRPFTGQVKGLTGDHVVVLEASSFQLGRIDEFRPRIAVFLNATDNHLDRHSDFEEYFNAKMRVFKNQKGSDWAVINCEDKNILKNAGRIPSRKIFFSPDYKNILQGNFASVENNRIFLNIENKKVDICGTDDLKIKGRHNQANALAAAAAAYVFGATARDIANAIKTFGGLRHRCEEIAFINGVRFIDDSKSTTVDAAIKALSCCDSKVVMIAGGRDKNSDFSPMRRYIKDKVKTLILIGESRGKIKDALSGSVDIRESDSLDAAVESAFGIAGKGESILLSPMCTSFDMFEDFQHRGRVFRDAVMRLKRQCASQE